MKTQRKANGHGGFENLDSSKLGSSAGMTENLLASSANISSSPDSYSTGEDSSTARNQKRDFEKRDAFIFDEEEAGDKAFATESDELEMATAILEEATQAPIGTGHDPSNAMDRVEEIDDSDDEVDALAYR